MPYLNANLYWQSKLPNPIPEDKDLADPTAYFYYPVSLKLPNAALLVSGGLLSLPATGTTAAPAAARVEARSAPGTCACRGRLSSPSNPPGPSEPPKRRPGLNARRKRGRSRGRSYRRR